ncbi:MAG: hypothetical protein FJ146_05680 [Deltaproteobacteria bacterium]|nr:hypothetical protein [Deltaproteobacteria bacterium]
MRGPTKIACCLWLASACIEVTDSGDNDDSGTKMAGVVQDVGGVVAAEIQGESERPQQINASAGSAIRGAAVLFPPGSLKATTVVKLEQGESILHPDLPSQVGQSNEMSLTEATRAIVVSADNSAPAADAFAMALPLADYGTLAAADPDLTAVSVVYIAADPMRQRNVIGIIPTKEITLVGRRLHFMTKLFGLYQGVIAGQAVNERKEFGTARRILTTQSAATLPGVTWSPIGATVEGRSLHVAATPSGLLGTLNCAATLVGTASGKVMIAARFENGSSGKIVLGDDHTGEARLRLTCTEENGRTSTSPWSDVLTLPASGAD